MKSSTSSELVTICKEKLLRTKAELLNRMLSAKNDFFSRDRGSDEGDQSVANLAENEFLSNQERYHTQVLEIEKALARIESGKYGICEETEEPIEHQRLMAIPWTRLSIEGAEIQESMKRRYANK